MRFSYRSKHKKIDNKEINVTLEDALFSAKSMALMFGDEDYASKEDASTITKTWLISDASAEPGDDFFTINGKKVAVKSKAYYDANDNFIQTPSWGDNCEVAYVKAEVQVKDAITIEINADKFPGTYLVTGDTYVRSEDTGEDEFFQIVFSKVKVLSEVTLTMEAEGDPSTFSMNLKVLKPRTGPMMKLIKYDLAEAVVEEDGE